MLTYGLKGKIAFLIVLVIATTIISYISWKLIEKPILALKK